uniref:Activin_recp domain-containing protein n=1 Tax=Rhabditophanes sp. KR3021 TaxID=114890 RepID=A0AC35U209_9BILA
MKKVIAISLVLIAIPIFMLPAKKTDLRYECYKCLDKSPNCNKTCYGELCVHRTSFFNGTESHNQGCLSSKIDKVDVCKDPNVYYCEENLCNVIQKETKYWWIIAKYWCIIAEYWHNILFVLMLICIVATLLICWFICWFIKARKYSKNQSHKIELGENIYSNKETANSPSDSSYPLMDIESAT